MKWVDRRFVWVAAFLAIGLIALRLATPRKAEIPPIGQQLEDARRRASAALATTPFPAGATSIASTIVLGPNGTRARISYLAATALSADDQALVEHHASSRLGLNRANVELRWIPHELRIRVEDRSGLLSDIAHQQLRALAQRVAEHRDLEVVILAPGDATRSAVLLASVRAVMIGAGIDESRIHTTEAGKARDGSAGIVTINVRRAGRN